MNEEIIIEVVEDSPILTNKKLPPNSNGSWDKVVDNEFYPVFTTNLIKELPKGVYELASTAQMELFLKKVTINTDELFTFSNSLQETIINDITTFWELKDIFQKERFIHKRGILLEGSPGNGKSCLVELISKEMVSMGGIVFLCPPSPTFFSQFVTFLKYTVRAIESEVPIICIIEDVDQLVKNDDGFLLAFLDGEDTINHLVTIMTTNNSAELSSALLRPSRVDRQYVLPNPNADIRREYFTYKKLDADKIEEYVNKTEGCSLADLKEVYLSTVLMQNSLDETVNNLLNKLPGVNYLSNSIKVTL